MRIVWQFATCILLLSLAVPLCAGQAPSSESIAVVIVTVLTKNSKPLTTEVPKEDIIIHEGGVRKPIAWIPARGDHASLQLAIIVDDASRNNIGNQMESLRRFILAQPSTTTIGIYYALGSSLQPAIQLTSDHAAVARALRLPRGDFGNLASPYAAVSQLIEHWPVTTARREILLLTPGFDIVHHQLFSPDMKDAIEQAQRAGILVHPILVPSAGQLSAYSELGRSNLMELANESGGDANLTGFLSAPLTMPEETGGARTRDTIPTLDFGPVLKSLGTVLQNQYFLVWKTTPSKSKDGELRPFTVRAEENKLQIIAPTKVFVP